MKCFLYCVVAAAVCQLCCCFARADENLVDRPPDPEVPAYKDQVYPDFPDFDTFIVAAVEFPSDVKVTSITTFFTNSNNTWPMDDFNLAVLNVFEGELLSTDDPTQGLVVEAFYATTQLGTEVTADLSQWTEPLVLSANTQYWIGLTPVMSFADFGNEFRLGSAMGPPSMARNPAGGFGIGTEWGDAAQLFGGNEPFSGAIEIDGQTIPAETEIVANAYSVLRGFLQSGDLAATFDSDNVHLQLVPGIALSAIESPVLLEFDGTLPTDCPETLTFSLEASSNTVNLNQTIELFNWTTSSYELVHKVEASGFNADVEITIDLSDEIGKFVQPVSGKVRSRCGWKPFDLVFINPWTVSIDHVAWSIGK